MTWMITGDKTGKHTKWPSYAAGHCQFILLI